jgi:hypothetical protein
MGLRNPSVYVRASSAVKIELSSASRNSQQPSKLVLATIDNWSRFPGQRGADEQDSGSTDVEKLRPRVYRSSLKMEYKLPIASY